MFDILDKAQMLKLNFLSKTLSFLLITLCTPSVFAIVNMDGIHFDNQSKPFAIDVDLTITGTTGNSDTQKASFNSQFSWISDKSINLFIMGHQYGESKSIRNVNNSFLHYRYIHKLNDYYDWELFTQVEKNEFTRLVYRGLIGTGFRYSLARSDTHHAFLGFGAFQSKEEIAKTAGLTDDGVEEYARANIYFLSKYKIKPTLSFTNTLYYQPRLDRTSDVRALLQSSLDIKLNDQLSFRIKLDITHDSEPSQSVKETDISYMTGLVMRF